MSVNTADSELNIYDWILSPEIRNYLKSSYALSLEEKAWIVCGACRSIEEKYKAFGTLSKEAGTQEDRDLIAGLRKLYEWVFEELERVRPGQIYLWAEASYSHGVRNYAAFNGTTHVFCAYEEVKAHNQGLESSFSPDCIQFEADIEKWAPIDGKMERIINLNLSAVNGHLCVQSFSLPYKIKNTMAVLDKAIDLNCGDQRNTLPLPFRNGDLVKLDSPDFYEPVYGVLSVTGEYERYGMYEQYMYLIYLNGRSLEYAELSYEQIYYPSGWRVIDWLSSARPEELPAGEKLLVELSDYVHRLAKRDFWTAKELIFNLFREGKYEPSLVVYQKPIALKNLFE